MANTSRTLKDSTDRPLANDVELVSALEKALSGLTDGQKSLRSIERSLPLENEDRELIAQTLIDINALIQLCKRLKKDD